MARGGKREGAGRPAGVPNRITTDLREMILGALNDEPGGGQAWLKQQKRDYPVAYMTLIGKLVPTTLAGDPNAPLHTVSRIELVPVEPKVVTE